MIPISHSTVLVVIRANEAETAQKAQALAEQYLEPFNENTPMDPPWKDYLEGEAKDHYLISYLIESNHLQVDPSEIGDLGWNEVITALNAMNDGLYGIDEEGPFQWSTYNQQSRWDWYALGGRWRGYYPVIGHPDCIGGGPGVFGNEPSHANSADLCRKRDVDVRAMLARAEADANALWDKVDKILENVSPVDVIEYRPWSQISAQYAPDYDKARTEYQLQPLKKAFSAAGRDDPDNQLMWYSPEDVCINDGDRKGYIDKCKLNVLPTFAVLLDSTWHERGSMGWFGVVSGEQEDWPVSFMKLWDSLALDDWVAVYDVHI